jgi:hypothetical protein
MKLIILILTTFCSVYNCKAQNKIHIETITGKSITACERTEKGAYVRYRKTIYNVEVLKNEIIIKTNTPQKIDYQIKGNINSNGLNINHVKKIRIEQELKDGVLILKHFTEIVGIAGKEGNDIMGYNYIQNENFIIPKNVKKIKFELYHEFSNQRTHKPTKLEFEKEINTGEN